MAAYLLVLPPVSEWKLESSDMFRKNEEKKSSEIIAEFNLQDFYTSP